MRSFSHLVIALSCFLPAMMLCQNVTPQIEPATPWSDEHLTVEQIEHVLDGLHDESDKDLARELGGVHLTQRLTTARFERLNSELPGKETRQAFLAMADEAAFLDLPRTDLLDLPAPNRNEQERIVSQAVDFAATTVSKMPDFTATRTTTRFQDANVIHLMKKHIIAVQGFRFIDRNEVTTGYRDGKEVDEGFKARKPEKNFSTKSGLYSWGVFGPLLAVVVSDMLKGEIGWSHWEQTPNGPASVFRFMVGEDKSSYMVRYCCVLNDGRSRELQLTPAYHGEIAISPTTGAVLRIVLKTNLKADVDLQRADLAVDYNSVDIGGRSYVCPVRSISISIHSAITAINHVTFDHYHQFRGEMRIVPEDSSAPQ